MKDSAAPVGNATPTTTVAAATDPASPAPKPGRAARAGGRGLAAGADKFTVVALGGGAGSLEALQQFFAHLPTRTGLAYVVVVHPLPNQPEQLAPLLQDFTSLLVQEARDGLRVHPDHVYVAPPTHDLNLLHGVLYLLKPTRARGRRLPIDYFLQSLAKDAGECAVCILLSGQGADGSLGLKLIMENFGMVMVQDPGSATHAALPKAALATEFVDFVLPPELMPAQLLDYAARPLDTRPLPTPAAGSAKQPSHALQKIFLLIRQQTGHDFSFYKRNTVFRRIERRMNSHQIKEFTHYVRYIQENPYEVELLFRELLIGVTKFFRDTDAFAGLQHHIKAVLLRKEPGSTVRVWAPGCSTGEEAYSLAIALLEVIESLGPERQLKLQLFATDISAVGIDAARAGLYRESVAADVSPVRLERYFVKADGHYQVRKELRDLVIFALHNINKDAPFTKLDLLCCRNLLIYLSSELQRNLLPVFHYALNPGGLLFLGPSENLTGFLDLFQPLDVKWKISRRTEAAAALPRLINFPFGTTRQSPVTALSPALMLPAVSSHRHSGPFATLIQKTLLQAYTPPAVVINAKGEILYVNGRTGRYLEPAPGMGGLNVFEMARRELSFEISGAVHRAVQTREDVVVENIRIKTDLGQQLLRLTVKPLTEPDALQGLLLVVFEDQPTPQRVRQSKANVQLLADSRDSIVAALDKELQYTKHRLQTTIEEMESSLEELKSTNEELQSANEELQSTNEEAMTNKEEMQSLNEELLTLNMQYLAKTEELSQSANDMKNLLDATEIAIIFLDNDMVVKRFTPQVSRIINLLPADVGRSLAHFASNLRYAYLLRDVQQVLSRLTSVEVNIETTRGDWFTMRILPYRSLDNYINGAVITFTEITALKQLETSLQDKAIFIESMQEAMREPVVALDRQLRLHSLSSSFAQAFGLVAANLEGQPLATVSGGAWNQPALRERLQRLLDGVAPLADAFDDFVLEADFPGLGRRRVHLYGRRMLHQGQPTAWVLLGVRAIEEI